MIPNEYLTFCDTFPLHAPNMVSKVYLLNPHLPSSARKWVIARAAWDTGATICAVTKDICDRLGLRPFHTEFTRSFDRPEGYEVPLDMVVINLSKGPYVISTPAFVMEKAPDDYDMLIGKNVIASGSLNLKVEGDLINFRLEIDPRYPYLKKLRTVPEFPEENPDIPEL